MSGNRSARKGGNYNNNNNKRRRRGRNPPRRRNGTRGGSVASVFGSMDRAEQGFMNTFVPALSTAKYRGRVRYGAASLEFSSLTGTLGDYVFSANGLFDPNSSGGALQPAGFAQLMSIYNHYIVSYARISVVFTNNSTTPSIVGILVDDDTTISTDTNNVLEMPYAQFVQLEGSPAYGSSKTINMSLNLSKYFGENVLKTTGIYRGDVVSNPTEQAYFHCVTFGVKGGSSDIFMNVKIDYSATFTEPRDLPPSLAIAMSKLMVEEAVRKKEEKEERKGGARRIQPDGSPESVESYLAREADIVQVVRGPSLMKYYPPDLSGSADSF